MKEIFNYISNVTFTAIMFVVDFFHTETEIMSQEVSDILKDKIKTREYLKEIKINRSQIFK